MAGIAAGIIWFPKPLPPGAVQLSVGEVSFSLKAGASTPASRTLSLKRSGPSKQWTSSATDEWLTAVPQNGTTPASIAVSVDPSKLGPGSYSGLLMFASEDQKASLRVKVTIEREPEKKPVETTATRPEVKTQQPGTKTKRVEQVVETKPEIPPQPDPVITRPAVEEPPKVAPAIVDCHAANYHGLHKGTLRWINGTLEPNGILTFGGQSETIAGGRVTGNLLPGCDVTVTSETGGVEVISKPARETGFQRIRIQNKSNAPVSNVILQWREK
jgi:hypothetical protein